MKIDKNVPIPDGRGSGAKRVYPWDAMNIGDSFFLKGKALKNIAGAAYAAGKKRRWKFTCRAVNGGVRVWRIK